MSWYSDVANDITKIPASISFFEVELIQAKYECKITGNIERATAAMPGIVEHRYSQLQEIDAILEYLNIEHRRLKSHHFRKYLEHYQRALSSRDCEKYIEGEADVVDFEKMINEYALLRNKWLGVSKALDQKSYALSNIIRLRCAGLEDSVL
jgi:hypothetical protein